MIKTKAFTLADSSSFNVHNNVLVIDYSATPTVSPYAGLVENLRNGLTVLAGADRIGIRPSLVTAKPGTTLGVYDNGQVSEPIDTSAASRAFPSSRS